ncbi:hypothetical protein FBR05_13120 [Deltaproteobacteria bacterium PRO3]|nr:hypothetical protein [Deltaproteobacteria bacterium PRO3]
MKKKESEMHSMNFHEQGGGFDSKCPESLFSISLAESQGVVTVDFSANPNFLLEIEEFRNVVGLSSAVQAGLLVNQDGSCWLTNLGRSGSTEVYRPMNKTYRKLAHQQVAYLRHGDFVGFYGAFYRVDFDDTQLSLVPVDFLAKPRFQS